MPKSTRADKLLVEKGLAETRTKAQALIMSGKVFSANKRIEKAGTLLKSDTPLQIKGKDHPYVSRGGIKLMHALQYFKIEAHPLEGLSMFYCEKMPKKFFRLT